MTLTCKQCGVDIAPENIEQNWTRCANCQAVINLTKSETSTDLAQAGAFLPKGMSLRLLPAGLQITYHWFNPAYMGLAFVALLWNWFLLQGFASLGWWLLLIPHFWVGVALAAVALINLINRTIITVNPDVLSIVHLPIPFPRYRRFDPILLKQLYVKEVKHRHKSSVSYTYDLYVTTWSGRSHKIVPGIKETHLALALEKETERSLGIKDRSIPGEFRWLSDQESNQLRRVWQALAAALSLKFEPGPISEKGAVAGVYRGYDLQVDAFYSNRHRGTCTRIWLTLAPARVGPPSLPTDEDKLGQPWSPQQVLSRLASGGIPRDEGGQIKVSAEAQKIYYEHSRSATDVQYLRRLCDMMVNLAEGYTELRAIGAETLPALETVAGMSEHVLNSVIQQLIRDIAADTTERLGDRPDSFYCRKCLTRCAAHSSEAIPFQKTTYYGCRTCRQSQALLEWSRPVVAVLDSGMTEKWVEQNGTSRVNWLIQRTLFDFDAVEIIGASDEDIERFAVQVGNDTDPLRQPRYKEIHCRIGLTCRLSENSLRVLQSIFRVVERGPLRADVSDPTADEWREEIGHQDQVQFKSD